MPEDSNMTPRLCVALRALLGWTQDELARHAGVRGHRITNYEHGQVFKADIGPALEDAFRRHGISLKGFYSDRISQLTIFVETTHDKT